MVEVNSYNKYEIGSIEGFATVNSYPNAVSVNSLRDKSVSASNSDLLNNSVEIRIDLRNSIKDEKLMAGNQLLCSKDNKHMVIVRNVKGTVLYCDLLTKLNSIVNIPVGSIVHGHTLEVKHEKS